MVKNHRPTLKQVAQVAQVSQSTASMILNQKSGVSFNRETVDRVYSAALRLGYLKEDAPVSSVFQKRVVAIFTSTITGYYYTALIQAIEQAAQQENYEALCFQTYHSATREMSGISMFSHSDIAGIIFTYVPQNYAMLENIPQDIPVVVIGDHHAFLRADMVETNNYAAGMIMARHILSLGHRHVAFLNDFFEWQGYPTSTRLKGVQAVFDQQPDAVLYVQSQQAVGELALGSYMTRRKAGYEMMQACLAEHPQATAIMAITDVLAYGVLDALYERNLRVPEDYSVCGFDNNFASDLLGLTTLDHHMFEIGIQAFLLLHAKIRKEQVLPLSTITKTELLGSLIPRRSTAALRA